MAVVHSERLATTERTEIDTKGHSSRIREFIIGTPDPDAAKLDPRSPRRNEKHPFDTELTCDNITTDPSGQGSTILRAYYSNDGRFASSKPRNLNLPALPEDWVLSARDVVVKLPYNVRTTIETPAPPGSSTPGTKRVWELDHLEVEESRIMANLTVRIPLTSFADIRRSIIENNKTIHTIRGVDYLFVADLRAMRRVEDGLYEVRYTWEFDEGTSYPDPRLIPDKIWFVGSSTVQDPRNPGVEYFREPYSVLKPLPPDGSFTAFTAKCIFSNRRDPNGWRSLPGVPNL